MSQEKIENAARGVDGARGVTEPQRARAARDRAGGWPHSNLEPRISNDELDWRNVR
mgnify:CR=1 FL=1